MSTPASKFGWYELMTTDTAAAGAFYSTVVEGWKTKEMGVPGMPYTIYELNGIGIAGMMPLPKEAGPAPAWIGYIHVPAVDDYAQRVVAAGGKIHKEPTDVPGMLRFCVVIDPQGAPYVLFTTVPMENPPATPAAGTPGTIGWHELMAEDGAKAFDYYSSQYGWGKGDVHDMGQMGPYQMFTVDGVAVGGIMTRPPNVPSSFWNFYFQVDGMKAAVGRIEAAGGKVCNGPHQVPGGSWIVQGMDPQGASFCLVSGTE